MPTEPPLADNLADNLADHSVEHSVEPSVAHDVEEQPEALAAPQAIAATPGTRAELLRDVVVFQVRLTMDGLRDLVLSPVSIFLALAGIVFSPKDPHKFFRRLMLLGRRSDVFINLFNARVDDAEQVAPSSDSYVNKLEAILVDEFTKRRGASGLKASTIDLINRLRSRHQRSRSNSGNDG